MGLCFRGLFRQSQTSQPYLKLVAQKKTNPYINYIYIHVYTLCLSKIPQRPPFTTSKSLNFFHEMRQFDPPFHFHCHNGKRHLCNKATNPGVDFFVIHLSDLGKCPSKKHPWSWTAQVPQKILVFREKIWHLFGERMFCEISAQKLLVRAYSRGLANFTQPNQLGEHIHFPVC